MAIRNVSTTDTFEEWRVETNEIASDTGDVSTLTSTATNLTDAVNEKEQTGTATAMAIALGG
jgi:hypothetical protein